MKKVQGKKQQALNGEFEGFMDEFDFKMPEIDLDLSDFDFDMPEIELPELDIIEAAKTCRRYRRP